MKHRPIYVAAKSSEGDCNEYVLTRTHMKPRRNAIDFLRCISRKQVLLALEDSSQDRIECSDLPGSDFTADWEITHNPDGSITVGCTEFPATSVARIRKWAEGRA